MRVPVCWVTYVPAFIQARAEHAEVSDGHFIDGRKVLDDLEEGVERAMVVDV